ncbi:hypothetical protein LCGC14_2983660 [marine sediment metagenome]|uniref:Uncharacterized protein n=1 Tax=marine sediment metagenome TaxID=412755 RepID=A0A0F8ZDC8_9ZZZZ
MNPLRRLALWAFDRIPLGSLAPYVMGLMLDRMPERVWPECPSYAVALAPDAAHADDCEEATK